MSALKKPQVNKNLAFTNKEPIRLDYKPHVKWMYKTYKKASLVLLALAVILGFGFAASGQMFIAVFLATSLAYISLIMFIIVKLTLKPIVNSYVLIFEDYFELHRMGKIEKFEFDKIKKIKFVQLKMKGGWIKIFTENSKPRKFTVILENSHLLLEAIANKRSDIVDIDKLSDFKTTSIYTNTSWDRAYDKLKKWPIMLGKIVVMSALLIFFFDAFTGFNMIRCIRFGMLLNIVWMLITYGIEEKIIANKTLKKWETEPVSSDTKLEFVSDVQKKALFIYLAGYITFIAVLVIL